MNQVSVYQRMTPTSMRNMFQDEKWQNLTEEEQLQFGVAFLEKASFDKETQDEVNDVMQNESYDYDVESMKFREIMQENYQNS